MVTITKETSNIQVPLYLHNYYCVPCTTNWTSSRMRRTPFFMCRRNNMVGRIQTTFIYPKIEVIRSNLFIFKCFSYANRKLYSTHALVCNQTFPFTMLNIKMVLYLEEGGDIVFPFFQGRYLAIGSTLFLFGYQH